MLLFQRHKRKQTYFHKYYIKDIGKISVTRYGLQNETRAGHFDKKMPNVIAELYGGIDSCTSIYNASGV